MTLGDLSEEDVEAIRTGAVGDPTVSQVVALAGVFGVEPSYLLDRGEPVFDGELVEALRDGAVREATCRISRLPERERLLVLGRPLREVPRWPRDPDYPQRERLLESFLLA